MDEATQRAALCPVHLVGVDEAVFRDAFETNGDAALMFHGTANAALRAARQCGCGVWFVSLDLPDLAGLQLLEMLIGLAGEKLVVAVGNAYSALDETAALSSGACQYFVKPLAAKRCRAVIEAYKRFGAGVSNGQRSIVDEPSVNLAV